MRYFVQRDGLFHPSDLEQAGEEEWSGPSSFSTDEWMEWLEDSPRHKSLWDRGEEAAEGLAQSLAFPPWLTSVHVVFRSRERPVVVEVGARPEWDKPIRLPSSVDGFPVEVVPREPAVVQMMERE